MSLKRLAALTAVGMLGALALSSPANARDGGPQGDDTWGEIACVLNPGSVAGVAGQQAQSLFADEKQGGGWDAQQLYDTDGGTFSLSGDMTCEGADLAGEAGKKGSPEKFLPAVLRIDAKGIYDNLFCGTLDAKGTAVIDGVVTTQYIDKTTGVPVTTTGPLEIHMQFGLRLVAGIGKMSIVVQQSSQDGQGTHSRINDNNIEQGKGHGLLQFVQTQWQDPSSVDCVGRPGDQQAGSVNEFTMMGAFETGLAGEGSQAADQVVESDA